LPELPEGWVWATIEQLAAHEPRSITDGPFGSNLKTAHYTVEGPRVVRLQNVGEGKFLDDNQAHISRDHFNSLQNHCVFAGDLVIAALGDELPRACIVPESLGPAIVKADCIRFRPDNAVALGKYLNAALNSLVVKNLVRKLIHGVGRPRLNLQEIRSLPVPLPPIGEQTRIAQEVERILSTIEEFQAALNINLQRAEALRQSILKEAFAGRLVPQDPNDEPASELLKRIRAERSNGKQQPLW
jgi:type I restriction enzyme, S subunit